MLNRLVNIGIDQRSVDLLNTQKRLFNTDNIAGIFITVFVIIFSLFYGFSFPGFYLFTVLFLGVSIFALFSHSNSGYKTAVKVTSLITVGILIIMQYCYGNVLPVRYYFLAVALNSFAYYDYKDNKNLFNFQIVVLGFLTCFIFTKPSYSLTPEQIKDGSLLINLIIFSIFIYKGLFLFRSFSLIVKNLQNENKLITEVFENSNLGMALLNDHNNSLNRVNNELSELVNLSSQPKDIYSLLGINEATETNKRSLANKKLQSYITKKTRTQFRWLFHQKDGTYKYCDVILSPIELLGKQYDLVIVNDVDELVKARDKKIQSEELYQTIFETAFDGIDVGIYSRITKSAIDRYVNQKLKDLFKLDKDYDINNLDVRNFFPEYQPNGKKSMDLFIELAREYDQKKRIQYEWQYLDSNGEPFMVEISAFRHDAGDVVYTTTIIKDISEKYQMQSDLLQNEERYRLLFENAFDAVWVDIKNLKTNEIEYFVNQKTLQLFEEKPNEGKAYQVTKYFPEFQRNGKRSIDMYHEINNRLKNESQLSFNWQFKSTKGKIIDCNVSIIKVVINDLEYIYSIIKDITDFVAAENKAEHNRSIMNSFIHNSFDGIEIQSYKKGTNDKVYYYCNKQLLDFFEVDEEQARVIGTLELSPEYQPDGRMSADLYKQYKLLFKENRKIRYNWTFKTKSGKVLHTEVIAFYYSEEDLHTIVTSIRDISEEIELNRKSKLNESLLNSFIENSPDGIEISIHQTEDFDRVDYKTNKTMADLFGVPQGELKGLSASKSSPEFQPDGRKSKEAFFEVHNSLEAKNQIRYEWLWKKNNGDHFMTDVTLIKLNTESQTAYLALLRDITEQRNTQVALERSEEMYRLLFDNAYDGIEFGTFEKDTKKRIRQIANDKFLDLFKIDREELLDLDFTKFFPEYQPNGIRSNELWAKHVERYRIENNLNIIWQFINNEGTPFLCEMTAVRFTDKTGNINIVTILKDITEKANNELVIKNQMEQLNLKNIELEKYIESNMQLENFAYIASHDLKTPIRTMVSFAQLLNYKMKDKLDDEEKEYLEYIEHSSKDMHNLIEDLLNYSRVNNSKVKTEEINVRNVIGKVLTDLDSLINEHNAAVNVNGVPEIVSADPIKTRQLFQNLIQNAIKFSKPDTNPKIDISGKDLGKYWEFTVTDNGIGIKPEYHDKIFLIFRRLHRRENYKGNGIGLALCKKIVQLHEGNIKVDSIYGEGSTFTFTFAKNI